jgi:hypothetical protein
MRKLILDLYAWRATPECAGNLVEKFGVDFVEKAIKVTLQARPRLVSRMLLPWETTPTAYYIQDDSTRKESGTESQRIQSS